jgi:4-hydroxybutyrate CoA-transferase
MVNVTATLCSAVNSIKTIAANPRVVSINSAIEIDLTGQVCADSIGAAIYSGVGGQPDFVRGALASLDGRGISVIALPSTTSKGHSRIVPTLQPGAGALQVPSIHLESQNSFIIFDFIFYTGVVTLRSDVEWVATEFGLCNLKGKSLRQRAKCLIQIAHPDCRDMLEAEARKRFHFL